MGVVRYLCITIFLVSLAVSALAAGERSPTCNLLGHVAADGNCLCESGVQGTNCESGQMTCGAFSDLTHSTAEHYPKLDTETHTVDFSNNILTLSVAGPLVNNRSYTDIKFVGSNDTRCSLNQGSTPSFWKLTADNETCQDRLALTMPWIHHNGCHFSLMSGPDVPADVWEFRAVILVSYVDRLPNIGEEDAIAEINRRTSASFEIFVQFIKDIRVNLTEVVLYSDASLKLYLTQFQYDPDHMVLTVSTTIWVNWPNQIKSDPDNVPFLQNLPEHLELVENRLGENNGNAEVLVDNAGCGFQEDRTSSCIQVMTFYLKVKASANLTDHGCGSFNGLYMLNMTLSSCRSGSPDGVINADCPWIFKTPNFTIVDHNTCGNVSVEPTITADLTAYVDDMHTTPTTEFNLGSVGYFVIGIHDNTNFLNLTIIDFYANPEPTASDSTPAAIYIIKNKVVQEEIAGEINPNYAGRQSIVDLHVNPLVGQSMDGVVARAPEFSIQFDGWVFRPDVGKTRTFTFNVVAQITYFGNEGYAGKRDIKTRVVDFVYKPTGANVRASMDAGVSAPNAEKSSVVAGSNSLLTAILPVAGVALVVIAGAVVAAVIIIKKKSSNAYTAFSN